MLGFRDDGFLRGVLGKGFANVLRAGLSDESASELVLDVFEGINIACRRANLSN